MKFLYTFSFLIFITVSMTAQTWTQRSSMSGNSRVNPVGFSIGGTGYVLLGSASRATNANRYSDMWAYDTLSNTWTQKASLTGNGRTGAIAFTSNNKGYAGLGWDGSSAFSDIREYDPINNSWSLETTYPGSGGRNAFGAFLQGKLFIGGGTSSNGAIQSDFWIYDFSNGLWTRNSVFPMGGRTAGAFFAVDSIVFFGMGHNGTSNFSDLWGYNINSGLWSQYRSFPGVGRIQPAVTVVGDKVIVGSGHQYGVGNALNDYYEFDYKTNTWTSISSFTAGTRSTSCAFTIGNKAYVSCGFDQTNTPLNDLWELGGLLTNVEEIEKTKSDIEVYPNPTNGIISFDSEQNKLNDGTLKIFSQTGKVVKVIRDFNTNQLIDLGLEENGIYYYQIINNSSIISNGKFVLLK